MSNIVNNLGRIGEIISEIESEDPGMAGILREGFGLSLNLIKEVSERGNREVVDISEHLDVVSRVLNVSIKDLVENILQNQQQVPQESDKTPDQDTLDFITADMDDYERFLAQNKAKDDLDFLSKNI
jgi:hypothetical protein